MLYRNGAVRVTRPFSDWHGLPDVTDGELDGRDLFLPGFLVSWDPAVYSQQSLGVGYRKNLSAYHKLGHAHGYRGFFDLSQASTKRPRVSKECGACMTFTTNSTHLFSPAEGRCLSGVKLLSGQNFVASTALGEALHAPMHLGVAKASRIAAARWAGNAMHTAAVGSVLLWVAAYGERVVVCPTVTLTPALSRPSMDADPRESVAPSTSRSEEGTSSSVTTMYAMFKDTAFNQPIGDWGVSSVISICVMFGTGAARHPGFPFSLRGREWVGSIAERGTRRYCGRDGSSPGTTCPHRVP